MPVGPVRRPHLGRHHAGQSVAPVVRNRGKTPGTPVQHALALGTRGAEFRHFLASNYGTTWDYTKSSRGFAPLTVVRLVCRRAALRAAPDWLGLHPVRPGQMRQHPAETAEDRRAGKDQRAPDPCRYRLGLSLSA